MAITNKELYEALDKIRREIEADYKDLDKNIDRTYTKLVAFAPVKNLVYGLVSIVMTGVVMAIIGLVIVK
jgi:hypothetical protein